MAKASLGACNFFLYPPNASSGEAWELGGYSRAKQKLRRSDAGSALGHKQTYKVLKARFSASFSFSSNPRTTGVTSFSFQANFFSCAQFCFENIKFYYILIYDILNVQEI